MLKKWAVLLLCLLAARLGAQTVADTTPRIETLLYKHYGFVTLGLRNTFSTFNGGSFDYNGMGIGGHFRLPITPRINTEWYADYITNNIGNLGHRTDYHIGWSVMYYVIHPYNFTRKFTPFVEAGHCFDYGGIYKNSDTKPSAKRWSSAVQAGVGTHYNITPRFDLTLKAQYMMHLGNDIHGHVRNGVLEIEEHTGGGIEGHLLLSFSVNYKIARLWTKG